MLTDDARSLGGRIIRDLCAAHYHSDRKYGDQFEVRDKRLPTMPSGAIHIDSEGRVYRDIGLTHGLVAIVYAMRVITTS